MPKSSTRYRVHMRAAAARASQHLSVYLCYAMLCFSHAVTNGAQFFGTSPLCYLCFATLCYATDAITSGSSTFGDLASLLSACSAMLRYATTAV
eukprot:6355919-Pyramimonas_sp.AAC.1